MDLCGLVQEPERFSGGWIFVLFVCAVGGTVGTAGGGVGGGLGVLLCEVGHLGLLFVVSVAPGGSEVPRLL